MPTLRTAAAVLPLVALAAGCGDPKPVAPPLTTDAVYQNDAVGLRFLVPDGWAIKSRADLPPGPLPKPVVLVAYLPTRAEYPADLTVMVADVPDGTDPGRYLVEHPVGADRWELKGAGAAVTVNGAEAVRYEMARTAGKAEFRREATAFRRGGRVYYFLVAHAAADPARRDAARRAVGSVTWTK